MRFIAKKHCYNKYTHNLPNTNFFTFCAMSVFQIILDIQCNEGNILSTLLLKNPNTFFFNSFIYID